MKLLNLKDHLDHPDKVDNPENKDHEEKKVSVSTEDSLDKQVTRQQGSKWVPKQPFIPLHFFLMEPNSLCLLLCMIIVKKIVYV